MFIKLRNLFFYITQFCLLLLVNNPVNATVNEYRLDNGLKLIVKEDKRAPVVVNMVWYKVGSSYEHEGITGISHVLEHMMFKGTEKYPAGEFSRIISEQGGRENAFTGRDYTAYFQTLEKSRLPVSFELEADRMRNLVLDQEEFIREIEVVKEERRLRTEDNPQAYTSEVAMATIFQTSPYRHPIIGWMHDLESMNVKDLKDWYQKWYAPNNATVVVVGDVNADEVFQLAEKYFAPLPAEDIHVQRPRPEAQQQGMKQVVVKRPAQVPYVMMAYKAPSITSALLEPASVEEWEIYALEVLASILDGGDSARFNRNLVRGREIATSASASYDISSRFDQLFTLTGVPAQDHEAGELIQSFRKEIQSVRDKQVSMAELDRVKTQVIANDIYEKDSVFFQAYIIGVLETMGLSWRLADEYVDKINQVTAEQIQKVAKKYLVDDHLTIAILEPQAEATSTGI